MSLTPAGAVFVGTTGLMAAIDGGLSAVVGSLVIGGITYFVVRRTPTLLSRQIVESQMLDWKDKLNAESEPAKRVALEREMAAAHKSYLARINADSDKIRFNAALIGIGTVMAPSVGMVIALIYTSQWWGPAVMSAVDRGLDIRHQTYVLRDEVAQFVV